MRRPLPLLSLALAGLLTSGCIHTRTPYDENLDRTTLGDKTGEAHWQSVLGLFAWGDAGTKAAAQDGGLTVVNHADVETFAIFFGLLYLKRTTIVYGD